MKLSISNIAWTQEQDDFVYQMLRGYGFSGLEIAPTRIFPQQPYDKLQDAKQWAEEIKQKYGISIPSMQSIWFGKTQRIFGQEEERQELLTYTKKAIDFAEMISCGNLVFGCPRNRAVQEGENSTLGIAFFKALGDYAWKKGTVIGMEANPPMYQTNYINDTKAALELISKVESRGFLLNLDMGTMIANQESVELLEGYAEAIHHVHISEPGLKPIQKRTMHQELACFLRENAYSGYVSIEMGKQEDTSVLEESLGYIKEIFG